MLALAKLLLTIISNLIADYVSRRAERAGMKAQQCQDAQAAAETLQREKEAVMNAPKDGKAVADRLEKGDA